MFYFYTHQWHHTTNTPLIQQSSGFRRDHTHAINFTYSSRYVMSGSGFTYCDTVVVDVLEEASYGPCYPHLFYSQTGLRPKQDSSICRKWGMATVWIDLPSRSLQVFPYVRVTAAEIQYYRPRRSDGRRIFIPRSSIHFSMQLTPSFVLRHSM